MELIDMHKLVMAAARVAESEFLDSELGNEIDHERVIPRCVHEINPERIARWIELEKGRVVFFFDPIKLRIVDPAQEDSGYRIRVTERMKKSVIDRPEHVPGYELGRSHVRILYLDLSEVTKQLLPKPEKVTIS